MRSLQDCNRNKVLVPWLFAVAVLLGCTGTVTGPQQGQSPQQARHVIIISMDTTRADFFGCYGNPWMRTPQVDALAAESILLTNAMTAVTTTLASHTSLFTGNYPHHHGVPRNGFIVSSENLMLPEILSQAGFYTAGFLGSFVLDSRFNFAQGFDHLDEFFAPSTKEQDQYHRSAEEVTDAVIEFLEGLGEVPRLFLFVHYWDPHTYTPDPPYDQMYSVEDVTLSDAGGDSSRVLLAEASPQQKRFFLCYAGEISYMDEHIGRLIEDLRTRGILEEAVLVLTSDHGESLLDFEPYFRHGWTTYQATTRIVGMVRLPKGYRGGTTDAQLVSNIDFLPTVLRSSGVEIPQGVDGEAIELNAPGPEDPLRMRFAEATKPRENVETDPLWVNLRKMRCVRQGKYKYIQTLYRGHEELYDLSVDPHEQNDLLISAPSEIKGLPDQLRQHVEDWGRSAKPLETRFTPETDTAVIKELQALGYLGQ